ncbi:MAG: class I SAM-dependent methyltransferase [bacterium]|nr:class I SAM-dependent methyltransferase [bacterium]
MRRHLCFAILLAALAPMAFAAGAEEPHQGRHGIQNLEAWVEKFENPERNGWQFPGLVIDVLGIVSGDHVADLGAGTGYFSRFFAQELEGDGKVYAVDIEAPALEYLDNRKDVDHDVIETVLAQPDDPNLPDGEIDVVVVVNTWHHIEKRPRYLKKLRRALDPTTGRVAIIDWYKGELPMGPPPEHKLERGEVIAEFEAAGWNLSTESTGLPYQYFLIFRPRR